VRSIRPGRYEAIPVDMGDDAGVAAFGERLAEGSIALDGLVMMPPQMTPTNDCLPPNDTWRTLFQCSFIGPLGLLKAAIAAMHADPAQGQRAKVVIISAITSVQAPASWQLVSSTMLCVSANSCMTQR
jgi:3-oxoacyl-[acyl-carrier protein] reductase